MPIKDAAARRAYQAAYAKKHYAANKARYVERAKAHNTKTRQLVREWVSNYLAEHPCVDCGEADPIVLEFDHRPEEPKSFNISDAIREHKTLRAVQAEVAKCEVRCANCHRRMTHKRRLAEPGPSRRRSARRENTQQSFAWEA